jgi:hypothetical protein
MGRCLVRKDETKIHAELQRGNLLQQESIENGGERVWVLTLSWVSVETFLNVEYSEWTCSKCRPC